MYKTILAMALISGLTLQHLTAASLTWDSDIATAGAQDGAGTWDSLTANWWDGAANATWSGVTPDSATFGSGGTAETVTLAETLAASNLLFAPVTGSYTISGGTLTLSSPSTLTAGTIATIASTLAGDALLKNGSGTLTLSSSNTFAGGATIAAGQLALGNDAALGTGTITLNGGSFARNNPGSFITNAIAVGAGGGGITGRLVVDTYMTLSGPLSGTGALTLNGLVQLSAAGNPYSGPITITGASSFLSFAANDAATNCPITFASASTYFKLYGGTTSTVDSINGTAGQIFNSQNAGLPATLRIGGANGSGTYGGTIVDSGAGPMCITKLGSGTQTLTASCSYTGPTVIENGVLAFNLNGASFNTGLAPNTRITINPGGTLRILNTWNTSDAQAIVIAGGTLNIANTNGAAATDGVNYINSLTFTNGGFCTGQAVRMGYQRDGVLTVTGNAAATNSAGLHLLNNGKTIFLNVGDVTGDVGADLTISGTIVDDGSFTGAPVIKTGPGTLLLTPANTYAGSTTIAQGTLLIRNNYSVGSANTVYLGNATTGTNSVAFLLDGSVGGWVFPRPMVVTTNGTGPAIIGTSSGAASSLINAGAIQMNRPTTLQGLNTDRTTYTGVLSGSPGSVTVTGGYRTTLEGNNTFTGRVSVVGTNTTLQIGRTGGGQYDQIPDINSVDLEAGTWFRFAFGDSEAIDALTGYGVVEPITAAAYTFTLGSGNGSGDFGGVIRDGYGGTITLTKSGTGTQTLSGTNLYTGATTINGGRLVLATNGSINNSAMLFIASNAVFDVSAAGFTLGAGKAMQGSGTVTGNVAISSSCYLLPGGIGVPGVLTFDGNLSLAAGVTTRLDLSASTNSGNDAVVVNGSLQPGGSTISIDVLAPLSAGSYPLLTYTGALASSFVLATDTVPSLSRMTLALDQTGTPGRVDLVVSGAPAALRWVSPTSPAWDVRSSTNWFNDTLATAETFFEFDSALFDDTPGAVTSITINTTLYPSAVTVNASTNQFTFAGPGSLAGSFTLTKTGASSLTLAAAGYYTGNTVVNGGTLVLAANAALGTSQLTMGGGTALLRSGGVSALANTITLTNGAVTVDDGAAALVLSGMISGSGGLTKSGTGTLTLTRANAYEGGTSVTAGTLAISDRFALGSRAATVGAGATLTLGANAATNGITLAGGTLGISGGTTYTMPVTLAAGVTNTISAVGNYAALTGALTGAGGLLVTGTGTPGVQLTNPGNSFSGNVTITSNTYLRLTASEVLPDAVVVNIETNGNLRLEGGGLTETIGGLTGRGMVWIPTNADNHTLRVGANDTSSVFDGSLGTPGQHLTIQLVKIGAGTFTLTSTNNAYTGATAVNGGTLLVNGVTLGAGAVSVNAGATLGGAGTVAGVVTVQSGGHLAPGAGGVGTLTLTNGCTLASGSILDLQLGDNSDLLRITGGTFTGASAGTVTLAIADSGNLHDGTYLLADWSGATATDVDANDFTVLLPSSLGLAGMAAIRNDALYVDIFHGAILRVR